MICKNCGQKYDRRDTIESEYHEQLFCHKEVAL